MDFCQPNGILLWQELNIDDVDKTMDEISEAQDQMQQMNDVLSQPIGTAADLDEDDLAAELAVSSLMQCVTCPATTLHGCCSMPLFLINSHLHQLGSEAVHAIPQSLDAHSMTSTVNHACHCLAQRLHAQLAWHVLLGNHLQVSKAGKHLWIPYLCRSWKQRTSTVNCWSLLQCRQQGCQPGHSLQQLQERGCLLCLPALLPGQSRRLRRNWSWRLWRRRWPHEQTNMWCC